MRPAKGDIVQDRIWPEFGKGLVTKSTKNQVKVLFDGGCKKYAPLSFDTLSVFRTAEERQKDISAAYERFKGQQLNTSDTKINNSQGD